MVWIPRKEEIPLSVMISDSIGEAAVTIRKNGLASTSLFNLVAGDKIGIRGPYGNSFSTHLQYKHVCLVGGGTGLVPLVRLLDQIKDSVKSCTFIIGARMISELFFVDIITKMLIGKKCEVLISTEDGSKGFKGYPTDLFGTLIDLVPAFDMVYTCGPELMMKGIFDRMAGKKIQFEASIERYMKCGIGICSSCSIDNKLVCLDGTVFNEKQICKLSEFGIQYRDKSGILQKY